MRSGSSLGMSRGKTRFVQAVIFTEQKDLSLCAFVFLSFRDSPSPSPSALPLHGCSQFSAAAWGQDRGGLVPVGEDSSVWVLGPLKPSFQIPEFLVVCPHRSLAS